MAQQLGVHDLLEFLAKGASDLKILDIAGSFITERDIANIGKLKNLEILRLQSPTAISASSLSSLASLHRLETLCLDLELTDRGSLASLTLPPRLKLLEVSKLKLPYDLKRRLLALPRTEPFRILER